METLLIAAGAVVLALLMVLALLRRAKQIDGDHPDGLGSLDLRERGQDPAVGGRPVERGCRCGKCDTGDELDLAEAVGVTPAAVAGADLDRKRRPIREVNRRFASIAKAPELRDLNLNATRIEEFYLAPTGEEFRGLINRGRSA